MKPGRRIRLFLAIVLLLVSLALLTWGFLPVVRERRIQRIQPGELQIPTPGAVLPVPSFTLEA